MPPKRTTPAQWIELLVEHAKRLRDAGVTRLRLEDCEIDLAPSDLIVKPGPRDDEWPDPLNDGATFNRGGRVPGFPRQPRDED